MHRQFVNRHMTDQIRGCGHLLIATFIAITAPSTFGHSSFRYLTRSVGILLLVVNFSFLLDATPFLLLRTNR